MAELIRCVALGGLLPEEDDCKCTPPPQAQVFGSLAGPLPLLLQGVTLPLSPGWGLPVWRLGAGSMRLGSHLERARSCSSQSKPMKGGVIHGGRSRLGLAHRLGRPHAWTPT